MDDLENDDSQEQTTEKPVNEEEVLKQLKANMEELRRLQEQYDQLRRDDPAFPKIPFLEPNPRDK